MSEDLSRVGASPRGRVWEQLPLERSRVGKGKVVMVFLKGNGSAVEQGCVEGESNWT